jgi:hypothetical protein
MDNIRQDVQLIARDQHVAGIPRGANRPHVPANPEIRKGTNRIGASRIQQIGLILEVPASFFFDGAPGGCEGEPVRLRPRYSSCSVRVSARFLLTRSCASPTPGFDAASCASSKKRPR